MKGESPMARWAKLAAVVASVFVLCVQPPCARAEHVFIPLDGSDKAVKPSDFGYKIDTFTVNRQVIIQIVLTGDAAESFGHAWLTLTKTGETVVETTLGMWSHWPNRGLLKMTIDPRAIDGGELLIWSSEIKGKPLVKNVGGFRLSIKRLLTQAKEAVDNPAPAAEQRDPEEVFRKACERLVALESKHGLLNGVSKVKPVIERDQKGLLKSARLVFERNAKPPGKGPAKPKDDAEPFVYVSIQVWSGRSQQPPADLHEFEWKGQTYQMWVRVFGSDAELVKIIRKLVDGPVRMPPARQVNAIVRLADKGNGAPCNHKAPRPAYQVPVETFPMASKNIWLRSPGCTPSNSTPTAPFCPLETLMEFAPRS
jgi:hypothetical protein